MSPRNKEITVSNREQVAVAMRTLRAKDNELQQLRSKQAEEIAAVSNRYILRISELNADIELAEKVISNWAEAHPKEFGDSKTITFSDGEITKRLGGWTIEPAKKLSFAQILDRVRKLPAALRKKYVRKTEELNKQALIADREKLDAVTVRKLGFEFVQYETITVSPKID